MNLSLMPKKDIQVLTGIRNPHSTHRIVNSYQLLEPKITTRARALSVDGGTVRLRTPSFSNLINIIRIAQT